jgi:hypothetical protein
VIPRSFPPAPGWSADGHRVKAPLEHSRGTDKTWVDGALRVADGHEVTMTAPSRNSANYQRFLGLVEQANPTGTIVVVTDNLSSHTSASTRTWLADHPRIQHAFIPRRACWRNLQEGWWRLFRREALAGETFADAQERYTRSKSTVTRAAYARCVASNPRMLLVEPCDEIDHRAHDPHRSEAQSDGLLAVPLAEVADDPGEGERGGVSCVQCNYEPGPLHVG